MGKGKMGAQCSHAAVHACLELQERDKDMLDAYFENGAAKIVVGIDSEAAM